MGSPLPVHRVLFDHSQVGFMDEGRGLQSVSWPFLTQVVTRQPSELFIDQGCEPLQSLGISPAPFGQERGHSTFLAHSLRSLTIFLPGWPGWIGLCACVRRGNPPTTGLPSRSTEETYEKNDLGLHRIDSARIGSSLGAAGDQE